MKVDDIDESKTPLRPKPIVYQGPCKRCGGEVWSKIDRTKYCGQCKPYQPKSLSDMLDMPEENERY